ncbi:MAG: type II toxin-antitoxin system HicB family antitoxin [Crocosphaera sp.]|nr:type II toxin-antitoxin system HicB family antitoxin [Crocosphaera sp.]
MTKLIISPSFKRAFRTIVPALLGCATQGDTFEELLQNLYEAIEGYLSIDIETIETDNKTRILDIAV